MKPNYKVLFHFKNDQIEIVEIKRNGIMSDDKSKIYYWLLYDQVNDMLTHLVFRSMKTDSGREYRVFEDSSLVFDDNRAQFAEGNKKQTLHAVDIDSPLSSQLKETIGDYLLLLSFKR